MASAKLVVRKCGGNPPRTVRNTGAPLLRASSSLGSGSHATTTQGTPSQDPDLVSPTKAGMVATWLSVISAGAPNFLLTWGKMVGIIGDYVVE